MKKTILGFVIVIFVSIIILGTSALLLKAGEIQGDAELHSGYWICDCTGRPNDCKCKILE